MTMIRINLIAERNPATAHMFIINPLSGQNMDKLFSTHPRTENRIARLVALAEEWGTDLNYREPQPRRAPSASADRQEHKGPWAGRSGKGGGRNSTW